MALNALKCIPFGISGPERIKYVASIGIYTEIFNTGKTETGISK